jgi:hypothetical protein
VAILEGAEIGLFSRFFGPGRPEQMRSTSILIKISIKTKQIPNLDIFALLSNPEFRSGSKVEGRFFQGQFLILHNFS